MYMRSYFCEEEIFPNDLNRVNKVSNSLSDWEWLWEGTDGAPAQNSHPHLIPNDVTWELYKNTTGLAFACSRSRSCNMHTNKRSCGLWQLLLEGGGNISNHLSANEKQHFIHIHVFTDAQARWCALQRLRTQLVDGKGEGGEHTDQLGHTVS